MIHNTTSRASAYSLSSGHSPASAAAHVLITRLLNRFIPARKSRVRVTSRSVRAQFNIRGKNRRSMACRSDREFWETTCTRRSSIPGGKSRAWNLWNVHASDESRISSPWVLTYATHAETERARPVRLASLNAALIRVHAYSSASFVLR